MKITFSRSWNAALLGATLTAAVAIVPVSTLAQDRDDHHDRDDHARKYHDADHNDDHEWNSHEDRAYRMWAKENHRKRQDFDKLRPEDQQVYWGWRHEHSDAVLKIDIH